MCLVSICPLHKVTIMIRNDVYAVKADECDGAGWSWVFMSYSREPAENHVRNIRNNHSLGFNRRAKLFHPSDRIVKAFVAVGNTIFP